MGQQLHYVVGRVGVVVSGRAPGGRAGWSGEHAVVPIKAPAIQGGTVVLRIVLAVAQIPPDEGVKFSLQHTTNAVGQIESVDHTRGLLARIGIDRVVFRHVDLHARPHGSEVVRQLLPQVGGIVRPGLRLLQQGRVGLGIRQGRVVQRRLLVAMIDEEVRCHAEAFECNEHHRSPALVGRAGARISDSVTWRLGIESVLADLGHDTDLDGGIDRLHSRDVVPGQRGICHRIPFGGVIVSLP